MTAVFLHFLNLSITAGWIVLAVLLLRLCLKKAPRWITCVLWGLVALRLILPFSIESPISLIPSAQTVVNTEDAGVTVPVVDSGVSAIDKPLNDWLQTPVNPPVQSPLPPVTTPDTGPDAIPDNPTGEKDSPGEEPDTTPTVSRMERILNIAAPVWLVGIGLMLLYELLSVLRVRHRVLDAVLLRDNIWQSDRVSSPFIFGLFRPRIYIPYGLEEPVLEQVLSHERAHLHRRDHWIKPFAFTLLAVYWYNPLLWVGYILLCRDIEVACDERVVRGLDEDDRRRYATALLQCGVERRSIAACPLAFGEVSIKQRIKSVLSYRKPLLWVIIASLVVCSVAAVCLLTVPKSKDNKDEPVIVQYLSLLQSKYSDYSGAYYMLHDLSGDGEDELLIQDGTKLLVYTQGNNSAHLLVEQDFASGTSRFLTTGDANYPGIIYFCVGGGKNQYYYLSLDNVQEGEFVKIPLWTDNYGSYEEGETGRITELSDDKKLIQLSREAYQNNRDLVFSLFGGSASTVALDRKYQLAVYAYSSDSKNHRDVGVLQPETLDIIAIEGKYYQTFVTANVDLRYIWLSQYEADIGAAYWNWVPIGTEDDYSLSNIGKVDDGQREIPLAYVSVMDNEQSFVYNGKMVLLSDLLSQYDDEIGRYAVVEMDGDNGLELAVEFKSQNFILILKEEADTYYGYLFSIRGMYRIYTDGSFLWSNSAFNSGCSRVQLSGGTKKETELWHVELDGNDVTVYYVAGEKVSKEQFESLTAETKYDVSWVAWDGSSWAV